MALFSWMTPWTQHRVLKHFNQLEYSRRFTQLQFTYYTKGSWTDHNHSTIWNFWFLISFTKLHHLTPGVMCTAWLQCPWCQNMLHRANFDSKLSAYECKIGQYNIIKHKGNVLNYCLAWVGWAVWPFFLLKYTLLFRKFLQS